MVNTNLLNIISYIALGSTLLVGYVFSWELRKRRTMPPIRVERAKQPRWYWLCVATHAVLLALMVLVCGVLALASLFNNFFN
jgi:hypothetical protein